MTFDYGRKIMGKNNNVFNLEDGAYVMSIDARYIYRQDNPNVLCSGCQNNKKCAQECDEYKEYYSKPRTGYDSVGTSKKQMQGKKKKIARNIKKISSDTVAPGKEKSSKKNNRFKLSFLYSVKMPYSLALIQLYKTAPQEFLTDDFERQYTNAIINVNFSGAEKEKMIDKETGEVMQEVIIKDKKSKYGNKINYTVRKADKLKTAKSVKKLRDTLYDKGFYLDGEHYVNFMRSTSKSRNGKCLFIKTKYFDEIIKWARIGLEFKLVTLEEIKNNQAEITDVASLRAYESLVLSHIENTLNINADEMLLISDLHSSFNKKCSVTRYIDNCAVADDEEIEITNCATDGQGLLDYSKLPFSDEIDENGELVQYGMALLRNRWFKCCAFNTNIQKFFRDNGVSGTIKDMFGRDIETKKVKLITTPSSLKFLKFSYKCVTVNAHDEYEDEIEEYRELSDKADLTTEEKARKSEIDRIFQKFTYEFWLKNLDNTFGVVKTEHSNKDYSRVLSYQIINSMPLSREEVEELAKEDLNYVNLLKNNPDVVKWHIGEYVGYNKDYAFNILMHNKDVVNTKIYQETRDKLVEKYIENMRTGAIRVGKTDYSTMVSNPYEMLLHSIGEFDVGADKPLHGKREIWCKGFDKSQELFGARNPHICAGNVIHLTNVYHEEFDKYFNFTKNIAVMNFIGDDVPDRLQGCDTDSDTILLSANKILESKAKICEDEELGYLTPVNRIEPQGADDSKRYYNSQCMSNVDHAIAQNLIGRIINWSQKLNSYFWNIYNMDDMQDDVKKEILQDFYDKISTLSSMSQIEIDKAKKFFEIDSFRELKNLAEFDRLEEYKDKLMVPFKKISIVHEIKEGDDSNSRMTNDMLQEKYWDKIDKIKKCRNKIDEIKQCMSTADEIRRLNDEEEKKREIEEYRLLLKKLYSELYDDLAKGTKEKTVIKNPRFFEYVGQGKDCIYSSLECPMDYLEEIIDEIPRKETNNKYIPISQLYAALPKINSWRQINSIKNITMELDADINRIYLSDKEDEDYRILTNDRIKEAVAEVREIKIKASTIQEIFSKVYRSTKQDEELRSCKKRLFEVLYLAHPKQFLDAFKTSNVNSHLIEAEDGDIEIFSVKYKVINEITEEKASA